MSKINTLTRMDWQKIGKNTLMFVAPTLAIFFGMLANGVPYEKAWPLALFALYQSLADIFTKYKSGK